MISPGGGGWSLLPLHPPDPTPVPQGPMSLQPWGQPLCPRGPFGQGRVRGGEGGAALSPGPGVHCQLHTDGPVVRGQLCGPGEAMHLRPLHPASLMTLPPSPRGLWVRPRAESQVTRGRAGPSAGFPGWGVGGRGWNNSQWLEVGSPPKAYLGLPGAPGMARRARLSPSHLPRTAGGGMAQRHTKASPGPHSKLAWDVPSSVFGL